MFPIAEAEMKVLRAIVAAPRAWLSPSELARSLRMGIEETTDLLATLDVDGWVDVWEQKRGPVVTLSALGAQRLGVRLVERGRSGIPFWSPVDEEEPDVTVGRRGFVQDCDIYLKFVPSSEAAPDIQAETAELAALEARNVADLVVQNTYPSVFLGGDLIPWPGPGLDLSGQPCPACQSRKLKADEYCLYCDAWGLDAKTPSPRRRNVARPRRAVVSVEMDRDRLKRNRRARLARRFQTSKPEKGDPSGAVS